MQVLRFFRWNVDKINQEWYGNEEKFRIQAGLDFDENLRKKHPEIDNALAHKNGGMCPVMYTEFDEKDDDYKPISLKCGH